MQHTTKRRISIGLLLICLCLPASAQQLTQNIRGIVTDKASGTPIAYATIQVEDAPDRGAITAQCKSNFRRLRPQPHP